MARGRSRKSYWNRKIRAAHPSRSNGLRRRNDSALRLNLELLEERYLLSADPLYGVPLSNEMAANLSPPVVRTTSPPPTRDHATSQVVANGAGFGSPFPLEQTFMLNSLPGATKTIYLDFNGHTTVSTQWNQIHGLPFILTPAYSLDEDLLNFSDEERLVIQLVWERVSEDFRPFNVNVTTQETSPDALRNTGGDDQAWGVRVVIGGDGTHDWFTPTDPDNREVGGVAFLNSFNDAVDQAAFVFGGDYGDDAAAIAGTVSHETGHTLGLEHDGQFLLWTDISDEENPELVKQYVEYYPGHGTGSTSWAPIMGGGGAALEQWSMGEYFNATNNAQGTGPNQDDLAVITANNGFDYRTDDHGNDITTATTLALDAEGVIFSAEGIIERNTDVDYFSFVVEGLGELVSFDINPFHNGPNLDILAKLHDSNGNVLYTSDDLEEINAVFTDLQLTPGNYYLSIDGTGRPIAFIDPFWHPGPVEFNPENEEGEELPPDTSDWGYTDYGSLGYYSIVGTRKKGLVVGVDFDAPGGISPNNWTQFTDGGTQTELTNLISEIGLPTPYDLTITTNGTGFLGQTSTVNGANVPEHALPLDELGGYISTTTDSWSFVWSGLTPSDVYQVYIFGHASTAVENRITVVGGTWNGVVQTYSFTQTIAANGMAVNDNEPSNEGLSTLTLFVISDTSGKITINVSAGDNASAGIAGLAIAPTKVGELAGQKWNDTDGDGVKEAGENGLADWIIYLDVNNDGILNGTTDQVVTQQSPDQPQQLVDGQVVKSELVISEVGEIADVDVTININHERVGDIDVWLISPSGTRVLLFSDIDSLGQNFTNTTIDDQASLPIHLGTAPYTGRWRPDDVLRPEELSKYPDAQLGLSSFNQENSSGVWRLEVTDDANGKTGSLISWSLTVTIKGVFLEPFKITPASGNYSFTDLPPGLYHVREHTTAAQTQAGWRASFTPPPVTVRSGASITGIDFGNWIAVSLPGAISGQVWKDVANFGTKDAGETGLPGWIVYIDSDNDGIRDTGNTSTIVSTDVPKTIADFTSVQSRVNVTGLGKVAKVAVTLNITHSFVADLDVFLVSPDGTSVELFTNVGGQFNNFSNLKLDDSGARSISTIGFSDYPYTGTWRPEGNLGDVIGEDAAGAWILVIRDTTAGDTGVLTGWSLTISVGELFTQTDQNGNYSFLNLPPGTYRIREEVQSGWERTFPGVTGAHQVTVGGGSVTGRNFGNRQVQALPGDYNGSGTVDIVDYIIWRKTMGTTVTPFSGADGDGDGVVDEDDHGIWRANFGKSIPASAGGAGMELVAADPQPVEAVGLETPAAQPTTLSAQLEPVVTSGVWGDAAPQSAISTVSPAPAIESPEAAAQPVARSVAVVSSDRIAPQVRRTVAAANSVRDVLSSDAAILAWLATAARVDRPAAFDELDDFMADGSLDAEPHDACESLDVAFETIGAG